MRWPVLVLLSACGRLDFDPITERTTSGLRSLCDFERLAVIENGLAIDDQAGAALAQAIESDCGTTPVTRSVSQDAPGILDPVTDRPLLAADELVVIGGGDGPNRAIAYLLEADTPLVWSGSSTVKIRERATGRTIAQTTVSATHDLAFVMIIREPIGGATVLSAQGFGAQGTAAAALWFSNIGPRVPMQAGSWVVIDWTDSDDEPGASAGDRYMVLESG